VTLSIMGLCVLAWLATTLLPGTAPAAIADAERTAVEYAVNHPYLHLSSELKGTTWLALRQQPRPAIERPDPATVRREQDELDRLTEDFRRLRDRQPYFRWGLVPARPRLAAFVTHTFMHAGFLHLLGNMFFLYLVGPWVEDVWGRWLYSGFYLAAGAVAALTFIARHPVLDEPLIGASGAVAGVMGAFAVRFWNSKITFFYWLFFLKIYTGTFTAPAWVMLALWWLRELAYSQGLWAMAGLGDMGQVAFLAHVGGFAFGVATAFAVRGLRVEERFVDPAVEQSTVVHDAPDVDHALELARRGRSDQAEATLERLLRSEPEDADRALALWRVASQRGHQREAAARVLPALAAAARRSEPGLVAACWGEVMGVLDPGRIDPAVAVRIAEMLVEADLPADAEATLKWVVPAVGRDAPVGQLVRLARVADRLAVPAPFARLALGQSELAPQARAEMLVLAKRGEPGGVVEEAAVPDRSQPAPLVLVVPARATTIADDVLDVEIEGRRRRLRLDTVERCVGAIVAAPASRPYLVLDLVLHSEDAAGGELHVVRLTSRDGDPRDLVGGDDPVTAFGRIGTALAAGSRGSAPPPDANPRAWPRFASVEAYEAALTGPDYLSSGCSV